MPRFMPLARHWAALVMTLSLAAPLLGAASTELISLTNLWRYEQSGADLGSVWKDPAYDDSAWPVGPGVLATPDSPIVQELTKTTLTRIGTNGQYKITDYFRTRFTVSTIQPGWILVASNLVDDGAVVYLNGTELFRLRMPPGSVTATTLANETIDVGREGVFVVTNVTAAELVAGENLLAVEVHQPYITSSDVTFGLALFYAPQQPLGIVSQPANQMIAEGNSASMRVVVSGSLPRYQWFKDATPIVGAIEPSLRLPEVNRADAAQYFVVISNEVSSVTSRVASLTVVLDTEAPILVAAQKNFYLDVTFSEPIDANSVTNPDNFQITAPGGTTLPVNVVYTFNDNGVALEIEALTPGFNHVLFVNGVRDRFGNTIAPDSGVGLTTTITNVPLASVWRYNDTGADLGESWRGPDYNDSPWPSGLALLYNDASLSLQPPGVRRTFLQVTNNGGPFWTHYFRHCFTNHASPVGARLLLRHYLDDGAVFYLNGHELGRVNMPPGAVDFSTRASLSATEGVFSPAVGQPATNLIAGENMLAVEVHQFSLASPSLPDISFGLELTAEVTSFIDGPIRVLTQPQDVAVSEGGTAVFIAHLASAESAQWFRNGIPLPDASGSSLTIAPASVSDHGARLELVASNSFGMVTSRTARLTVRSDLVGPRLLNARMGTNESLVTLTFSEPLDIASAIMAGHYAITNELGEALAVLDATVTNGTNVLLVTSPRIAGQSYVVTVNGVRDTSAAGNSVARNGHVGIDYETLIFTYDWAWKYDDSGTNLGTAWRETNYDDSAWPVGPGLLGFDGSGGLPAPILTTLTPPEFRGITYYFRTVFQFTGDPASAVLRLRHAVDDGVVFYLNGHEIHRVRVPEGHNYQTLAAPGVEAQIEGPFVLPTTALIPGINLLAAEVHQNSAVSADVVFGAELVQAFPAVPSVPVGPTLLMHRVGGEISFTWDATDFALESATALEGPWHPVPRPTIPYVLSSTNAAQFHRLRADF